MQVEIGNNKIQKNIMSLEFPILCQIAEMADVLSQSVMCLCLLSEQLS